MVSDKFPIRAWWPIGYGGNVCREGCKEIKQDKEYFVPDIVRDQALMGK